ncbi:MAG TPA: hypothetical protein PLW66_13940 [Saprospiraceae bacterium]|nr:hypothetical protein [Saprospiraceae bacterium]
MGSATALQAQELHPYKGLRLNLCHFQVLKAGKNDLVVRCDVVNTGRYALLVDKRNPAPAALIVEADTLNLPNALRGKSAALTRALLQKQIRLAPGEIQIGLVLKLDLSGLPEEVETPSGVATGQLQTEPNCGDLVFDTVYLASRDDKFGTLHYVLRNAGSGTFSLTGARRHASEPIVLNVYFVPETRLTKGALLVAGDVITPAHAQNGPVLLPGQRYEGEIEFSLGDRSPFAPNLLLEVNAFQTVPECRFSNNFWTLILGF